MPSENGTGKNMNKDLKTEYRENKSGSRLPSFPKCFFTSIFGSFFVKAVSGNVNGNARADSSITYPNGVRTQQHINECLTEQVGMGLHKNNTATGADEDVMAGTTVIYSKT